MQTFKGGFFWATDILCIFFAITSVYSSIFSLPLQPVYECSSKVFLVGSNDPCTFNLELCRSSNADTSLGSGDRKKIRGQENKGSWWKTLFSLVSKKHLIVVNLWTSALSCQSRQGRPIDIFFSFCSSENFPVGVNKMCGQCRCSHGLNLSCLQWLNHRIIQFFSIPLGTHLVLVLWDFSWISMSNARLWHEKKSMRKVAKDKYGQIEIHFFAFHGMTQLAIVAREGTFHFSRGRTNNGWMFYDEHN